MHTLKEILAEPQTMYDGGVVHMQDGGDTREEALKLRQKAEQIEVSEEPTGTSLTPYIQGAKKLTRGVAGQAVRRIPGFSLFDASPVADATIPGFDVELLSSNIDNIPRAEVVDETLSSKELSKKISVQAGDFKRPRKPILQKVAAKLETGEKWTNKEVEGLTPEFVEQLGIKAGNRITGRQYRAFAKKELPINPITEVPELSSFEKVSAVLTKDKRDKGLVGFNRNIKQGTRVWVRIDIPAHDDFDEWVLTMTDKSQNETKMYGKTAVLKNVEFNPHTTPSLKVAKGKQKNPFATMKGDWHNISPEDTRKYVIDNNILEKSLDPNNEEWIQVGFNPERHGFFYTKSGKNVGQPVFDADLLIQIGGLVLARNATKPKLSDFFVPKKGKALERAIKNKESRRTPKLKIQTTPEGVSRIFNKGGQVIPMYDGGMVQASAKPMYDGGLV